MSAINFQLNNEISKYCPLIIINIHRGITTVKMHKFTQFYKNYNNITKHQLLHVVGLIGTQRTAALLYNCVLPGDGSKRPATCKSWCFTILM